MSDIKKEVGERLKAAREKKNLKQNRVAMMLGVHNSTLAKYESGEREPDAEVINKLAELYEVSTDWILGNKVRIINDQTKNEALEIYSRLPQEEKKLIDDMIKALEKKRSEK